MVNRLSAHKSACLGLVLGVSCALTACDRLTGGRVVIEMPAAVDTACIEVATQQVGSIKKLEQQGAVEYYVKRENSVVGVHVYSGIITVSFGWFGRETEAVERAAVRMFDDVQRAVIESCKVEQPPAKITRTCNARGCGELLKRD